MKPANKDDANYQELLARLGLYEQIPRIETVHPLAIDPSDRTILLCCHDDANECSHTLWYHPNAGEDPRSIVNEDGTLHDRIIVSANGALMAAYN